MGLCDEGYHFIGTTCAPNLDPCVASDYSGHGECVVTSIETS